MKVPYHPAWIQGGGDVTRHTDKESGAGCPPAQMPGSAQPWLLTREKKDSATMADRTVRPPTQVIWLAPSTVPSSDSAQGASGYAAHHDASERKRDRISGEYVMTHSRSLLSIPVHIQCC